MFNKFTNLSINRLFMLFILSLCFWCVHLGFGSIGSDTIPEMSAAEEYDEDRSWRMCYIAGIERRIDLKVIEPYKKVLSHGGTW